MRQDWGTSKDIVTRQEVAAAPEPGDELPPTHEALPIVTRRPPGRKNTRDWCRGKVGREHTLVIDVPDNAPNAQQPCGWRNMHYVNGWEPRSYYSCRHAELCSVCGKVFRRHYSWMITTSLMASECPDYQDPPA